jgi:hypothetical protein
MKPLASSGIKMQVRKAANDERLPAECLPSFVDFLLVIELWLKPKAKRSSIFAL